MGKAYSKNYHLKRSGTIAGRMICESCNHKIDSDTQDWLEAKKDKDGDWGFVSWHRACYQDQSGWESQEKAIAKRKFDIDNIVSNLAQYRNEDGRFSSEFYEALSDLGIETE